MGSLTVANTILQQMGGTRRLTAMVGANMFVGDDNMVMFAFKGCKKANKCRVTLDKVSDTYTLELFKFNPKKIDFNPTYRLEGVYEDMLIDLFESETGLYLRM